MDAATQSHAEAVAPEAADRPAVSVSESKPGRAVFVEADNTDGWIASDHTVEVTR